MAIMQNKTMEEIDGIVEEKLYNYLKKKNLSRKTLRLILRNKYVFVNKINFVDKLKSVLNDLIEEDKINEFYNLRLKSQIWSKGKRKYINSTLEKNLKRLDKIRHLLNYSFKNEEIIIKENNNFVKLIGLNYNTKKFLISKNLLDEYKRWLVLKHYLDTNEPTPKK